MSPFKFKLKRTEVRAPPAVHLTTSGWHLTENVTADCQWTVRRRVSKETRRFLFFGGLNLRQHQLNCCLVCLLLIGLRAFEASY